MTRSTSDISLPVFSPPHNPRNADEPSPFVVLRVGEGRVVWLSRCRRRCCWFWMMANYVHGNVDYAPEAHAKHCQAGLEPPLRAPVPLL
ncbi:hypothetical protein WG66_013656, partial [Moniliophthora roreri]